MSVRGRGGNRTKTSADYYFDSYAHFGIHEEMLKDTVRTCSYQDAIKENAADFAGKVVLDVGCGTGILSLFAAQAGARMVDCSNIIDNATSIVAENGFSEVITLIKGKIEEVELPVEHVDIIVSEWMGYFLLYESMLPCVLYARDKWLAPDGKMFPDKARLFLCGIEDSEYREQKINFWDDVYGFSFASIKEWALLEPLVDCCNKDQVITNSCKILELDMQTCTKEELQFETEYRLGCRYPDNLHALCAYFDIEFSQGTTQRVFFSTGPFARYTHWCQTIFYLSREVFLGRGAELTGNIKVACAAKNERDLDITISYNCGDVGYEQEYKLR